MSANAFCLSLLALALPGATAASGLGILTPGEYGRTTLAGGIERHVLFHFPDTTSARLLADVTWPGSRRVEESRVLLPVPIRDRHAGPFDNPEIMRPVREAVIDHFTTAERPAP